MRSIKNFTVFLYITPLIFVAIVIPVYLDPYSYIADDCYFYLQVASNIYNGYGSTFNQITQTNGYHPLWLLFCVLVFFIVGGSKTLAIYVVMFMQQLLTAGIIYLIYKISNLLRVKYWFVCIPIIVAYFLTGLTTIYGSEGHINGFLLVFTIYVCILSVIHGRKRNHYLVLTGILAGFALLARLDNVFFVFILFVVLIQRHCNWPCSGIVTLRNAKNALSLLTPFLVVFCPYLVYNYLSYGHIVPISGAIKSTFPHISFQIGNLAVWGKITFTFSVLTLIGAIYKCHDNNKRLILVILSSSVIIQTLYILSMSSFGTLWGWYYVVGVINIALAINILVDFLASKIMVRCNFSEYSISLLIYSFTIVILMGGMFRTWKDTNTPMIKMTSDSVIIQITEAKKPWAIALAEWLKGNLPKKAKILVWDYPGHVAYFSDLNILPIDGLMNDYKYNTDILDDGITTYLLEKEVTYYLGPTTLKQWAPFALMKNGNKDDSYLIEVFSPLYKRSAGHFRLYERSKIAEFREILKHTEVPNICLWRLEKEAI